MKQQFYKKAIMLLIVGVAMTGCAAIEKSNATDTEQMLAASGFKMKIADTPEKLAHVESMQQRELVNHIKDGSVYYAYADAKFCKCLYMGSEKNYQEYEKLSIQQNTAEMNQEAAMNWGAWGGWDGWGGWD